MIPLLVGGFAALAFWAGFGTGLGLDRARRRRPPPELSVVVSDTAPPARVRCRHYNLVLPFLAAARCAVCGQLDLVAVPGPASGGSGPIRAGGA